MNRCCLYCRAAITVPPSRATAGRGRFCSRSCLAKWRVVPRSPRWIDGRACFNNRRTCARCGRDFLGKPSSKYCSAICAARRPTFNICGTCGRSFRPGRLAQKYCCRKCADSGRVGRRRFRRPTAKARRAQGLVRYYIRTGKLVRPTSCDQCGNGKRRIEAAHYDYDQPMHVRWLSRSCHARWDKAQPKGGTVVVYRTDTGETAPVSAEAVGAAG